jgi:hypothetical protein
MKSVAKDEYTTYTNCYCWENVFQSLLDFGEAQVLARVAVARLPLNIAAIMGLLSARACALSYGMCTARCGCVAAAIWRG